MAQWTPEMEICLLKAMSQCGGRLVGRHKHFQMIQLMQAFNKMIKTPQLTATDLWKHCESLWNLQLLENMADNQMAAAMLRHGQSSSAEIINPDGDSFTKSHNGMEYGDQPADFTLYPVEEFHPLVEQRLNQQAVLESDGELSSQHSSADDAQSMRSKATRGSGAAGRSARQKQSVRSDVSPPLQEQQSSPTLSNTSGRRNRQQGAKREESPVRTNQSQTKQQMPPPSSVLKRGTRKRPHSREESPSVAANKKSRESSPIRSETTASPSPLGSGTSKRVTAASKRSLSSSIVANTKSPAPGADEDSGIVVKTRRSLRKH